MKKFLWVIESSLARYVRGNAGVPASYVMPKTLAPREPENLAGARLWMALRAPKGDSLLGVLHINLVERFEDGMNAGDLCLTVDPLKSYLCARDPGSSIQAFGTPFTNSYAIGVHEADENVLALLDETVKRNVTVKLQKPYDKLLKKIAYVPLKGDPTSIARSLIAASTSALCLDEIWSSGGKTRMPPFANFSYQRLVEIDSEKATPKMAALLSEIDPTISNLEQSVPKEKKAARRNSLPLIDVDLTPINPDKIFARRFIARDPAVIDYADALEKTENAEKRHQDMLREIVLKLCDMKLQPMQSTSIDLFLQFPENCAMFELKTANIENLMSQCAKGLFQLGCYEDALKQEGYKNNYPALIVEASGLPELDGYVSRILDSFNISVFRYYPEKPWPNKVAGDKGFLEEFLRGIFSGGLRV
jgi:hypothetical protein